MGHEEEVVERERRKEQQADKYPPLPVPPASLVKACEDQTLAFKRCLRRYITDIGKCQVHYEQVYQCFGLGSQSVKKA